MCFKAIQWFLLGFSLNLATLFIAKDVFGLEAKEVKSRMSTRQVVCKEKTHKKKICIWEWNRMAMKINRYNDKVCIIKYIVMNNFLYVPITINEDEFVCLIISKIKTNVHVWITCGVNIKSCSHIMWQKTFWFFENLRRKNLNFYFLLVGKNNFHINIPLKIHWEISWRYLRVYLSTL